jgi:mRNA interferase RelE/StbE
MVKKYRVLFKKSAEKEYKALPKSVRKKIDDSLEMLSIDPVSEILKFKKIRGKENCYRIRVGEYRIIYTPLLDVLIVRVIRIGHPKDVYRHF